MANKPVSEQPLRQATPPAPGAEFDVIIIGGGTIGLSAAYYATARGLKTLLLEQFDTLANPFGSSSGASRMFRIMYAPAYMAQLAEVSLAMWKEIETAVGLDLLWIQPLIFYGDPEATVEGNIGQMKQALTNLGVPYTWYPNPSGLLQQYPAFQTMPPDYIGLVQADSAVIRAKNSIAAFEWLGGISGAFHLTGQQATVTGLGTEFPYHVNCPAGPFLAPNLILCPGAWTNSVLAPFNVQLNLTIWQMTVAYFQAAVGQYQYPLWYEFGPPAGASGQQQLFYGFPPDEIPGYLKVSADFTNNIYTDPRQCTYQPDPQILSALGSFLAQRFNGVQPTPTNASTCLYTMSADGEMILDNLPGYENVAIFTGASGRGFKFTPLFGRILVDLATTGKTYYDISPFSITRQGIIAGTKVDPPRRARAGLV
jgi:monomeric sarcosine oxidase